MAKQVPRSVLADALRRAIAEHAPDILGRTPDATWDADRQARVLEAALGDAPAAADIEAGRLLLDEMLRRGSVAGDWDLALHGKEPLPRRPPRSRLAKIARKDVLATMQRRDALARALPGLRECVDAQVLAGVLMIAAADYSAVLLPQLLGQVPERVRQGVCSEDGVDLAWIDFALGASDYEDGAQQRRTRSPWQSVRRWILDPVSLILAGVLADAKTKRLPGPAQCLAAAVDHLRLPSCTLPTLARSARAFWSLHLDATSIQYATTMPLAPSLPDHAWRALLVGPRSPAPATTSLPEPAVRTQRLKISIRALGDAPEHTHRAALNEMLRVLRKGKNKKQKRPTRFELLKYLQAWQTRFEHVGGWVPLMGAWVHAVVDQSSMRVASGLGAPGVLRYLEGFAKRFLEHFLDLPPDVLLEHEQEGTQDLLDAVAVRLDALRLQLQPLGSAGEARRGLTQFLAFVAALGGPRIHLDSAWRSVVSAREVSSNVLTPVEFDRLTKWLSRQGSAQSYNVLRNKVLAILAYRLGVRWEELQTRQLSDLQIDVDVDGRLHGYLSIRANAYLRGKTVSFTRRLPLELFVTPAELEQVALFVERAAHLGGLGRPGTDMLFADRGAPGLPPADSGTHDVIQAGMRHVSGDASLEFHTLRHSAATFMTLRMFQPHGSVLDPARWLDGASLVCGPDFNAGWTSYACRVTERSDRDGSRLFAVSALLGHLDPETSMRCYVHLFDVVQAARVRRECELPTAVRAALNGTELASVHRSDYRMRKRTYRDGTDLW
ncbi:hypothetical protein ACFFGH_18465 [Lysobacter korlensis]|uniref:Tyr recombinase domain-containing protein n=1 Tax=Lysobacter korlensis TaxID=553636 RepID=A0ABV6RTS7_9GAMM